MEIDESERWVVAAGKIWLELTLGKVLKTLPRIVCPGCGMSTWIDGEGCALPACENHRVLIHDEQDESEEPD